MCLADVIREDTHETIMTNTSRVSVDGDTLYIRDIFGRTTTIKATIISADFEKNILVIKPLPLV